VFIRSIRVIRVPSLKNAAGGFKHPCVRGNFSHRTAGAIIYATGDALIDV
jgi:hypothetical protein